MKGRKKPGRLLLDWLMKQEYKTYYSQLKSMRDDRTDWSGYTQSMTNDRISKEEAEEEVLVSFVTVALSSFCCYLRKPRSASPTRYTTGRTLDMPRSSC